MVDDYEAALRALADPHTDGVTLAGITQAFPQLVARVAAHPNAYPELIAWISQFAAELAQERAAILAATPPTVQPVATTTAATAPLIETAPASTGANSAAFPASGSSSSAPSASSPGSGSTATSATPRRRRLLLPVLAGVAALALAAAGITTAVAVNRVNEAQSAAAHAADAAKQADDPAAASGTRSGAGTHSGGGTNSGSGTPTKGSSAAPIAGASGKGGTAPIVLILDASGSMVRETTKGRTRMDDARDAMLKAIDQLPDNAQVALLVFGTGTGNSDAEQAQGCTDVKTVAPLGKLDRKALGASIRGVKQSGYTPIGPALRTAAGILPKDGAGTIVLVSDGVDTCSPPPACEIASELHGQNASLAIHAVGFGVDKDEQAQQQLDCIGRVGGGSYLSASNVSQLSSRIAGAATGTDTEKTLSSDGFHNVQLGMTQDEVRARSTTFKLTDKKTVDGVEIIYVDCGWAAIEFRGGLVYGIRPSDKAPTFDGVAVGDKISRATEVYGEPVAHGKDDLGSYVVYAVSTGSPYGYAVYGNGSIKQIVLCRCTGIAASTSLADWEITFAGVGPIRLGMTAKEMQAALPGAVADAAGSDAKPVAVQPLANVPELTVILWQGKIAAIQVQGTASTTMTEDDLIALGARLPQMRGIRIGETAATVRNTVPAGTSYRGKYSTQDYTIATRTGVTLSFLGGALVGEGVKGRFHGFALSDAAVLEFPVYGDGRAVKASAPTSTPQPSQRKSVDITKDLAKNLLIPAGSCGSGHDVIWNQTESIQLQDGSGEAFPASGNGAGILSIRLIGSADVNGDGVDDAILVAQCTGTSKAKCCAGRASVLNAVLALDVSGSAPTRIGDPIWGGKASVNNSTESLAIDDDNNNPVKIDGADILTYEHPIYDNTMTPDEVAGASGWFRHTYSGGAWSRIAP